MSIILVKMSLTQPISCSNLTIETLEQDVKCSNSIIETPKRRHLRHSSAFIICSSVSIVNYEQANAG